MPSKSTFGSLQEFVHGKCGARKTPKFGHVKQGISTQGGNDICVATGITVRCRRDARCRQCTGRPSIRGGCRICVTVRLPLRPHGETMYWQANANTPPLCYPPFKCARKVGLARLVGNKAKGCHRGTSPQGEGEEQVKKP